MKTYKITLIRDSYSSPSLDDKLIFEEGEKHYWWDPHKTVRANLKEAFKGDIPDSYLSSDRFLKALLKAGEIEGEIANGGRDLNAEDLVTGLDLIIDGIDEGGNVHEWMDEKVLDTPEGRYVFRVLDKLYPEDEE